jgi:hypothetical protein
VTAGIIAAVAPILWAGTAIPRSLMTVVLLMIVVLWMLAKIKLLGGGTT